MDYICFRNKDKMQIQQEISCCNLSKTLLCEHDYVMVHRQSSDYRPDIDYLQEFAS